MVFLITVSGGLSTTAYSQVGVHLSNQANGVAGGQPFALFRCYEFDATTIPNIYSWTGGGLAGFALSPGATSGSGEISSAPIPFVFGTSFAYKFGLLVDAVSNFSSVVDSDFQATVTGIQVKGPGGQPVTDFAVVSASGTPYGSGGVTSGIGPASHGLADSAHLSVVPNPAGAQFELRFNLPRSAAASLDIYDSAGRLVRQLDGRSAHEGMQSVLWDGRNDLGALVPSGVYFARLSSQGSATTTRLSLLR